MNAEVPQARLRVGQTVETNHDRRIVRATVAEIGRVLVRVTLDNGVPVWRHPHEIYDELTDSTQTTCQLTPTLLIEELDLLDRMADSREQRFGSYQGNAEAFGMRLAVQHLRRTLLGDERVWP